MVMVLGLLSLWCFVISLYYNALVSYLVLNKSWSALFNIYVIFLFSRHCLIPVSPVMFSTDVSLVMSLSPLPVYMFPSLCFVTCLPVCQVHSCVLSIAVICSGFAPHLCLCLASCFYFSVPMSSPHA